MIRINLLTEARAAATRKKTGLVPTGARLNNLILLGGVALGLLYIGVMALVLTSRSRHLDEEIGKAQEEVARLRSIIDEVKGYEIKKASLEAKIQLINNLKTNQRGPVRLMDEISRALPDLVWLTEMTGRGQPGHLEGKDALSQRGRDLPREHQEESVFRGARFPEPRPGGGDAGPLRLGDDSHFHQRAGTRRVRFPAGIDTPDADAGRSGAGDVRTRAWPSS